MNLIGEGFPEEIQKQILQRQKIYGKGYNVGSSRSPENLVYLNANTSWCKLVSSVDVTNASILQSPTLANLLKQQNLTTSLLSKKYVLFNGISDEGNSLSEGIAFDSSTLNNKAYGIGGTEFGINPMMGIKSANIKYENRGSLRRATVNIKAWNRIQFEIIDILYLRLGFSMLLEWGHAMYYDNNGVLQTKVNNSLSQDFLNGGISYPDFLKKIKDQRLKSNGNYDAMFGKVSNIHWSFLHDGSYDITVDLVSIGDVIESFKVNSLTNGTSDKIQTTDLNAYSSDIGLMLSELKNKLGVDKAQSKINKTNSPTIGEVGVGF